MTTTTGTTQATVLLPVGQFFGTYYPKIESDERHHQIRLRDEVWEFDDDSFGLWGLLHGVGPDLAERPWTEQSLRDAAATHLPGVDITPLLHGMLAEGLAAEVTIGTFGAVEFAHRHRVGTRMLGLGNSAEKPWLYSIGFFDHPVVSVTRSIYDLWEQASGESLWTLCETLTDQERRAGTSEPELTDPGLMLDGFLGTIHTLLTTSVIYLEPKP